MTVILLEGPDGAGKTTLGLHLSQELGAPHVTTGSRRNSREELEREWERIERLAKIRGLPFVVDRSPHFSQEIYALAMGQDLFAFYGEGIERLIELRPVQLLVIYCRPSDPEKALEQMNRGLKTHKPPEYMRKVEAHYDDVLLGYDTLMRRFSNKSLLLKYDRMQDPDMGTITSQVKGYLECVG